jgi:hypothetical protein
MTNENVIAPSDDAQQAIPPEVMEKVVIGGDLSELNAAQRAEYYTAVCRSLGLNPLTKPFEFLTLNSKLQIPPDYVVEDATAHRKPPEVRICRLRNQSAVGTRPPSTSTPH